MAKIVVHARVAQTVVDKVVEEVGKRWPVATQSEAIARALEDWTNNIDAGGKSAKLNYLVLAVDDLKSIDHLVLAVLQRIEANLLRSHELQDASTVLVDEYTQAKTQGCDSLEDAQ